MQVNAFVTKTSQGTSVVLEGWVCAIPAWARAPNTLAKSSRRNPCDSNDSGHCGPTLCHAQGVAPAPWASAYKQHMCGATPALSSTSLAISMGSCDNNLSFVQERACNVVRWRNVVAAPAGPNNQRLNPSAMSLGFARAVSTMRVGLQLTESPLKWHMHAHSGANELRTCRMCLQHPEMREPQAELHWAPDTT